MLITAPKISSALEMATSFNIFNALPIDIFLNWSKFKVFADNKINLTQTLNFVLGRVENILGKGEDAAYQHFLLFPKYF